MNSRTNGKQPDKVDTNKEVKRNGKMGQARIKTTASKILARENGQTNVRDGDRRDGNHHYTVN